MKNLKLSKYIIQQEFFDSNDLMQKIIVFSTRSCQARVIDRGTWQKVIAGLFDICDDLLLFDLERIKVLVRPEENELSVVLQENQEITKASDTLYIALQPTASCQFACGYCGQEHKLKRYSQEDEDKIISRIAEKLDNLPHKTHLKISWFGGEPLLALNNIRSLTSKFKLLCQQKKIMYSAHLTTNGMLLNDKLAVELSSELHVRTLEVTLDGLSEVHDARRPTKAGRGTFEKTYSNLVAIAGREDFRGWLTIRCNVDKRNISLVPDLIQKLANDGLLKRFKFYTASVHGWGNDAAKLAEEKEAFANEQIGWFLQLIDLGYDLKLLPQRKYDLCLAANPDAELIDPYGSIFNCTEVSLVPAYEVEGKNKYQLGSIYDANSYAPSLRDTLGDVKSLINKGRMPCGSCSILPVCGGSCPKEWVDANVPCPPIKYNLQQILLLTFLRNQQRMEQASLEETFPHSADLSYIL